MRGVQALFYGLVSSGLIATGAYAQTRTADTAVLQTTATARRSVRPDLATLTLQFVVEDSTPSRAGSRLAIRADSVRQALIAAGIPRDSLFTGSRWYWWQGRMDVVPHQRCVPSTDPRRGCTAMTDSTYRAREVIEVRVRDLSKVGAVIDTALAYGITDISSIQFSATDVRAAQAEALREATMRVREQAQAIAAAAGGRLGRVLSLSTQPDYDRFSYFAEPVPLVAQVTSGHTEVTAPSVTVAMTVYGRWHLLDR